MFGVSKRLFPSFSLAVYFESIVCLYGKPNGAKINKSEFALRSTNLIKVKIDFTTKSNHVQPIFSQGQDI